MGGYQPRSHWDRFLLHPNRVDAVLAEALRPLPHRELAAQAESVVDAAAPEGWTKPGQAVQSCGPYPHLRAYVPANVPVRGIALVIKRLMTAENIYSRALANVPLYLSVAAWAAYMVMYEGFAKTLSNEEDLDSQEGDGKPFKDLNKEEYVCPKLHRGGASKTISSEEV